MKKNNWIIPIISYILAAFSFFFGSFDPFWNFLNLTDELRIPLTIGTSILILLIGHFINIVQMEADFISELSAVKKYMEEIPNLNKLRILPNGDEGLKYLSEKIQIARFVRNTRIPVNQKVVYHTLYGKKYYEATKKLLRNKNTIYKDLITNGSSGLAKEFSDLSEKYNSKYNYKEISEKGKGFLNFIIIEDNFNITEVIFGWPVSETKGYGEKCFISQDNDLISLFSSIFEDLWNDK